MRPRDIFSGLTADRLRAVLRYDADTGKFFYLVCHNQYSAIGAEAGWVNPKTGYVRIKVDGHSFMAHRLAWLYVTGGWPKDRIDHKNLVRSDNWFDNLRPANDSQNKANGHPYKSSKSGVKGVRLHECGKYQARIALEGGRVKHLGLFDTEDQAAVVYRRAAVERFGEFARVD